MNFSFFLWSHILNEKKLFKIDFIICQPIIDQNFNFLLENKNIWKMTDLHLMTYLIFYFSSPLLYNVRSHFRNFCIPLMRWKKLKKKKKKRCLRSASKYFQSSKAGARKCVKWFWERERERYEKIIYYFK